MKMRIRAILAVTAVGAALVGYGFPQARKPPETLQQKLIHSVLQDEIEKVKDLLAQGGDPNARVEFGAEDKWWLNNRTSYDPAPPLIVLACRFGSIKGPQIIRMLIEKGADLNIADKNGVTPLMAASELGFSTPLLLEHKAKVNVADKSGKTPLMYAMGNRGLGTAAALLEHDADINARDAQGETALMLAISCAEYDPIRLYGEDQTKKNREARERYAELVKFLIERGANVKIKDKAGNTALSIALRKNQAEIASLLRKAGAKQ